MRKIFLFALSAILVCGCTDNETEDNSVAFISLSTDDLTFDAAGGESSVTVELFSSSGRYKASDWELTGGESWCTPSTISGHTSISKVRFNVQANTSPNERTAAYTFTCGNASTQLVIFQEAYTMVHNPRKGELKSVLTELGFVGAPIKSLKITGTLDDNDFSVIRNMTHLINLDIGEVDVTILPTKVFRQSDIENIILPNNLSEIKESAFYNSKLLSIRIPASVETIERYAFGGCTSLATVTFEKESKLATIGSEAFKQCFDLRSIEIPARVETIGNYAFEDCGLSTVTFEKGSNLTTIGKYAFRRDSIIIYSSLEVDMSECTQVKELGDYAFAGKLWRFKIGTITPPKLGSEVFKNSSNVVLKVPAESVEAYKNSAWKFYFSSISTLDE